MLDGITSSKKSWVGWEHGKFGWFVVVSTIIEVRLSLSQNNKYWSQFNE